MLKTVTTLKGLNDDKVAARTRITAAQVRKHRGLINNIYELPKVDLHFHLGGSVRVGTIIDLAREQHLALPTCDASKLTTIVARDAYDNLEEYLTVYSRFTEPLLQTAAALERCAYEVGLDCAQENIFYFELRFAPMNYTVKGLRPHEVVKAVARGLDQAERETGVIGNILLCGVRFFNKNLSPYHKKIADFFSSFTNKQLAQEVARNTAVLAVNARFKDKLERVVGFDIAGPEKSYPAKNFRESFKIITKAGMYNTCHAGEGFGWESIKQALVDCNVDRIGHGTQLLNNERLVEYCAGMRRVPIEVCQTSNLQTCANIRTHRDHPVREFYRRHLRVILCTDARLVSNTTKTKEDFIGALHHGFTLRDLAVMELNGLKSAFFPSAMRQQLIPRYVGYVRKRFGIEL